MENLRLLHSPYTAEARARNGTQTSIDQAVEVNKRFIAVIARFSAAALIKIGSLNKHDVSLDDDVS